MPIDTIRDDDGAASLNEGALSNQTDPELLTLQSNYRGLCSRIDDPSYVQFWQAFAEGVGFADLEQIRADTLLYGAKAANLDALGRVMGNMGVNSVEIPDYTKIPVTIYEKWRTGEDISTDLRPFFKWAWDRHIRIRSSAVYAEDGEELTGAGIYESAYLYPGYCFEDFQAAVIEVYESVDSEKAVQYRAENGIEEEKMGIVLQESATGHFGTVDSVMCQVPDLMAIRLGKMLPMIRKFGLEECIVNDGPLHHSSTREKLYQYNPDGQRFSMVHTENLARFALMVERWYGRPVQIEFSIGHSRVGQLGRTLHIFQVRPLPGRYLEENTVEFPDEEPLYTGRAIGVGDRTLPVLSEYDDRLEEKDGVVLYYNTEMYGKHGDRDAEFPADGGVLILVPSHSNRGHIETLCAERGLLGIAPYGGAEYDYDGVDALFGFI